ncbi:uncharacterized protein LOC129240664 [Anastrepha obliqua]|uniref:uncharacterized protein LOC129240664 n=1 Tax=Anastrepha obliqua TaxID=95512 RepID=UPI00240A6ADC|nr:uncharacterized protein LOC129240664 [Anastrepha obliqua]
MESLYCGLKHRDYKTRNILSMAQRIKVIKTYKHIPNYQRLASHFGCSAKQIKNIIANKDELLQYYDSVCANKLTDEVANRRQEKIDFLGKAVYEFLLRALYLRKPIGTSIIRQKAFEVKEAIAIENFSPNNAWLQDFKATYNRLDLTAMMGSLPRDMDKRRSLKCIDIIEYVSKQEREERLKNVAEDENCNSVWNTEYYSGSSMSGSEKASQNCMYTSTTESANNIEAYEVCNEAYDEEVDMGLEEIREFDKVENINKTRTNAVPIVVNLDSDEEESAECALFASEVVKTCSNVSSTALKSTSLPPLPDIHSYPEALRHLRALEDFAMIEENYRAIGLITQLEQIFQSPPKLKRIAH